MALLLIWRRDPSHKAELGELIVEISLIHIGFMKDKVSKTA
jgi:hypothetical protein